MSPFTAGCRACEASDMFTGDKDPHSRWHADVIKRGVAGVTLVDHRTIANAGHFSFQSPFPESIKSAVFPPSQGPEGFDRERFHVEMNAEVLAFLNRTMLYML